MIAPGQDVTLVRADVARTATDLIAQWLDRHVHQDDLLLETLANGRTDFRNKVFRDLRGLPVDEALCEGMWRFLWDVKARKYPEFATPGEALDQLEVTTTRPPTAREIAEGWEVESASSEDGRRYLYGPGENAQTMLDKLRRMED